MAPWKENLAFDVPKQTTFSIATGSAWQLIAGPDLQRVGLIFSAVPGSTIQVFLGIDPTSALVADAGLALSVNRPVLEIHQKDWGPLPSLDWYAAAGVAGELTIVKLLLREWPRKQPWIIVNPPEGA